MKLAVCARGEDLAAEVDLRFGRCPFFVIVDTEKKDVVASIRNENAETAGGAGPQSARLLADHGVDAVALGNVGPKAAFALEAAKIKIYRGVEDTVEATLKMFLEGRLTLVQGATVASHSGIRGGK